MTGVISMQLVPEDEIVTGVISMQLVPEDELVTGITIKLVLSVIPNTVVLVCVHVWCVWCLCVWCVCVCVCVVCVYMRVCLMLHVEVHRCLVIASDQRCYVLEQITGEIHFVKDILVHRSSSFDC